MKSGKQKMKVLIFGAIALAIAVPFMTVAPALAATRDVPSSYATIQAAINAADNGDIIEVADGIYSENVIVNKEVTIQAKEGGSPIVDGSGSGSCFNIYRGGGLDNVTIKEFEIRNATYGIRIFGDPSHFNDLTISNNNIHDHTYNGILVTDATVTGLFINDNSIENNDIGISFDKATVTNLIVEGNYVAKNNLGMGLFSGTFIDVAVISCQFEGNAWEHIELGVLWTGPTTISNVQISNCEFYTDTNWAEIYIAATFDEMLDGDYNVRINYNEFLGPQDIGIYNDNHVSTVNGECNWWDAADGPSLVGPGSGDWVSDNVVFEPWLLSSGPDSVCGGYEEIISCMEDPKNHGQFVSCVAKATKDLVKQEVITAKERAAIQKWAAHADIP